MMGDACRIAAIENLAAHRADDQMLDLASRVGVLTQIFDIGLRHDGALLMARPARGYRALLVPLQFAARGTGGGRLAGKSGGSRRADVLGGVSAQC